MVMYPLLHSSQWTPGRPEPRDVQERQASTSCCTQARLTTDQAKRAELYREAQRLLDRRRAVDLHRPRGADRRVRQARAGLQAPPELRPARGDDLAQVTGPRWGATSLRRLLLLVPVLVGVSVVVFLVLHLSPGDPAEIMLGSQATQEDSRACGPTLGLDRAAATCSTRAGWPTSLRGDLGRSIWMRRPVLAEVLDPLPGHPPPHRHRAAALHRRRHRARRALGRAAALAGRSAQRASARCSAPACRAFWLGIVLMVVLLALARLAPGLRACTRPTAAAASRDLLSPSDPARGHAGGGVDRPSSRGSPASTMLDDAAPGLRAHRPRQGRWPERGVSCCATRCSNALIPIVTVVGVQAGYLLGGAVLTETVFAWPGVGTLMVQGILARDFPLVQGCVLVIALGLRAHQPGASISSTPGWIRASATSERRAWIGSSGLFRNRLAAGRRPRRGGGGARRAARALLPLARSRRGRHAEPAAPAAAAPATRSAPTSSGATCWPAWCGAARVSLLAGVSPPRRLDAGRRASSACVGRLLRRLGRHRGHAADRHPDGVSLHPARHRHRGRARPRPAQRDAGDRDRGRSRSTRAWCGAWCSRCASASSWRRRARSAPATGRSCAATSCPTCWRR